MDQDGTLAATRAQARLAKVLSRRATLDQYYSVELEAAVASGVDDGDAADCSAAAADDDSGHAAPTGKQSGASVRMLLLRTLCPLSQLQAPANAQALAPHVAAKAAHVYDVLVRGTSKPWYMLRPDGALRMAWDFLMFVLTAGLMLFIPMLMAFYEPVALCVFVGGGVPPLATHAPGVAAIPSSGVVFGSITNVAFLVDILLNFLTGKRQYDPDTALVEVVYDLRRVAAVYARTWLALDVVSCIPVECIIIAFGATDSYHLAHLNRLLKAFALGRRAHGDPFRFINALPFLRRNFNYSMRLVVMSASALLLGLHYFACMLWLVLRVQGFPANSWPVQLGLLDEPNVYEWWTWSVFAVTSAMIGLGYGSYPPITFPEAVLWIVEMIAMAGGFAVVNGFVLSAVLEMVAAKAKVKAKLLQARREVEQRRLPPKLQQRVITYVKLMHRYDMSVAGGSSMLADLHEGLRLQVALSSVGQHLQRLPVLCDNPQLLQRAALLVEQHAAPEGQLILIPGSAQQQLIVLTQGFADVYMGGVLVHTLMAGESFGEAALLPVPPREQLPPRLAQLWERTRTLSTRMWPCLFAVRALSNCSLLVLDAERFGELAQEYEWASQQLRELAARHAEALAELPVLDFLWQSAASFDALGDLAATSASRHAHGDASEFSAGPRSLERPGWWQGLLGEQGSLRRRHGRAGAEGQPGSVV